MKVPTCDFLSKEFILLSFLRHKLKKTKVPHMLDFKNRGI